MLFGKTNLRIQIESNEFEKINESHQWPMYEKSPSNCIKKYIKKTIENIEKTSLKNIPRNGPRVEHIKKTHQKQQLCINPCGSLRLKIGLVFDFGLPLAMASWGWLQM